MSIMLLDGEKNNVMYSPSVTHVMSSCATLLDQTLEGIASGIGMRRKPCKIVFIFSFNFCVID